MPKNIEEPGDVDGQTPAAPPPPPQRSGLPDGLPPSYLRDLAVAYAQSGHRIFPVREGAKTPPLFGDWPNKASNDPALAHERWTRPDGSPALHNVAIATAELAVVDYDTDGDDEAIQAAREELGLTHDTYCVRTPSGGLHGYYASPTGGVPNSVKKIHLTVDIRGRGGYVLAAGSYTIADGEKTVAGFYTAINPDAPILSAPTSLLDRIVQASPIRHSVTSHVLFDEDTPDKLKHAEAVVAATLGAKKGSRGATTLRLAMALRDHGLSELSTIEILDRLWSGKCEPSLTLKPSDDDDQGIEKIVENAYKYAKNAPGSKTPEALFASLNVEALNTLNELPAAASVGSTSLSVSADVALIGPPPSAAYVGLPPEIAALGNISVSYAEFTESGAAKFFLERYSGHYRYDNTRGVSYFFYGHAWHRDETQRAFFLANRACSDLAFDFDAKPGDVLRLTKASASSAALRIAQANPVVSITSSTWDPDPMMLGTPAGTVNLTSGARRAAEPADYITRLTALAPADDEDCPIWLRFLDETTGGDPALVSFLQRAAGYTLTGHTREHALFVVIGSGGNGKSVFINTLLNLMGGYAQTAAMDTFTASYADKHPTDLAMLDGPRIVVANETEAGKPWAEARIKQMTGGDMITARFMRENFFSYLPKFKLWIVGNHAPVLRNVTDAARRRINIVPFTRKPAYPDPQLEQKLCAEWPGILRWIINGCLAWQRGGLQRPPIVLQATNDYFQSQDTFAAWVAERCEIDAAARTRPSDLLNNFNSWAKEVGEPPVTRKTFREWTDLQGALTNRKINGNNYVKGIRLKPVSCSDTAQDDDAAQEGAGG